MTPRRFFFLIVCCTLLFLGVYTWNQRTGQWDRFSADTGLEFTGGIMRMLRGVEHSVVSLWDHYIDLRNVKSENDTLKNRVHFLETQLWNAQEDLEELRRLRQLLHLRYRQPWPVRAARVLAWRIGPNAALNTIMLNCGYLNGGSPGTPVSSWQGLVGRVLKSGPGTSVVLLLTDTGSRVSVVTSKGRVQGILAGGGPGQPLELRFVRQNSPVKVGELLISSGVDSSYPKGIPVARVTAISTGAGSRSGASVLEIQAEPLVDFHSLEEVLLLQRPRDTVAPESDIVYTKREKRADDATLSNNLSDDAKVQP